MIQPGTDKQVIVLVLLLEVGLFTHTHTHTHTQRHPFTQGHTRSTGAQELSAGIAALLESSHRSNENIMKALKSRSKGQIIMGVPLSRNVIIWTQIESFMNLLITVAKRDLYYFPIKLPALLSHL